jgi:hypothetical protein
MTKTEQFKKQLARIFDSDLRTKQWENYPDYVIIGLIIISTLSVFLSTFDLPEGWQKVLNVVDIVTVIVFTIEVSLRIWAADEIDAKYSGFWGRVKYCFTFYGLIDVLSTYSFYASFFIPLPYAMLKVLRVARLLRVFRYMRSFRLLQQAISSKSKEMFISLQFLVIITLILSFVLFFYEHTAQPDVYDNGFRSVVWAFAQYIGDPGGFADTPPVTLIGRIIACVIGILGIALFAVPAGLIGAGFSEAMAEELHRDVVEKNVAKLRLAFERKVDRITKFQVVPPYISLCDIQARLGMKVDDIFDAVEDCKEFRLINLAITQPVDERPQDRLAVESCYINRPYGCCIDRGSKITIVAPTSFVDPCTGSFAYYLALIGGFNYISREIGQTRPYRSYFLFKDRDNQEQNLPLFMEDLERLTSREGSWTVTSLAASGSLSPSYPTIFHFSAGGAAGDESFEGEDLVVKDIAAYRAFYEDAAATLKSQFALDSDHQRYHGDSSKNLFVRRYTPGCGAENNIVMRVAWSASLWDSRRIAIAKSIADTLNRHFESDVEKEYDPDLNTYKIGL